MNRQCCRDRPHRVHLAIRTAVAAGAIAMLVACRGSTSQELAVATTTTPYSRSSVDDGISEAGEKEIEAEVAFEMPDVVGLPFSGRHFGVGTNMLQNRLTEWYPPVWFTRFDRALADLYGLSSDSPLTAVDLLTFDDKYITQVAGRFEVRHVADGTVAAGLVIEQEPASGTPITRDTRVIVTVSAGRPAVAFDQLPDHAKQIVGDPAGRREDRYLMVNTPYGMAYKSDGLLFGPCLAVRAAYRTLDDGSYQDRCYDSAGNVSSGYGLSLSKVPSVKGLTYAEARDVLLSDQINAHRITAEWIASNAAPAGVVLSQDPPAGSALLVGGPVQLEVSAGGPAVGFDELPDEVVAWLATRPLATVPFVLDLEPILVVLTSEGVAYKTDQHLFGPCAAVRAAYGTFEDQHYDTITPNPCSRLGDIDVPNEAA